MAELVVSLSAVQRYEEAARVRDEAERLRRLLVRHRMVESLRRADRMVLMVDGEGTVELDGGLLVETGSLFDGDGGLDRGVHHQRRRPRQRADHRGPVAAGQRRQGAGDRVRPVRTGMALPADRIPRLGELCAAAAAATNESAA